VPGPVSRDPAFEQSKGQNAHTEEDTGYGVFPPPVSKEPRHGTDAGSLPDRLSINLDEEDEDAD